MQVSAMRDRIAQVYPGPAWKTKCYKTFHDNQVIAVYHKFLSIGMFNKKKKIKDKNDTHQIDIFEYAKSIGKEI